jgi:hypothetical protein
MATEPMAAATLYCEKCNKVMNEDNFYQYRTGGKVEICKKCLTMHINNFEPETFLWILEKLDYPYVEEEWNSLRDRAFAKNPLQMNGMSVFGKYLSKMKLRQWKDYGYADSEQIRREIDAKKNALKKIDEINRDEYEKLLKRKLENGEISEAQYMTLADSETMYKEMNANMVHNPTAGAIIAGKPNGLAPSFSSFMAEEELADPSSDLTQEDKVYLAMKWGRFYKPSEWVELERHYTEMINSFDIQDADTTSALILICKT